MALCRILFSALAATLTVCGAIAPAVAADLTIGIGADVTSIDPHYHNLTPNNNVAAHIFDYLVLRDERQKPIPGLAESWKTIDPLTWEFKLRQRREVSRWKRVHGRRRGRVDRARPAGAQQPVTVHRFHQADQGNGRRRSVHDPVQTATPYPLMPTDMTQVAIISKSAAKASTEDFNSGKAAIGTGPVQAGPVSTRATASSLRATMPTGAARRHGKK